MANFRESSKQDWKSSDTREDINAGSLQRIADATEAMAKNYIRMQQDLDFYKRRYNELLEQGTRLRNTIKGLRGHITRLKRTKAPLSA